MANVLPTLTTSGWVRDTAQKADFLFSYFLVSDRSQSILGMDGVQSLPFLLKSGRDERQIRDEVERSLLTLFSAYFDAADCSVTITEARPDSDAVLNLRISVIVTQDGRRHSLGKLINTTAGKIGKVATIPA